MRTRAPLDWLWVGGGVGRSGGAAVAHVVDADRLERLAGGAPTSNGCRQGSTGTAKSASQPWNQRA